MNIDEQQLDQIESLARLQLTDEEKERLRDQLSQILDHVEKLNELDLENVEPMTHPLELTNVLREDDTDEPLDVEDVLQNAPEKTGQFFKVPQVIEEENS